MNRSQTISYNNIGHSSEVFLAKYYLSLRSAEGYSVDNGAQFDSEAFKTFCD
jgi:transposase InsO family protein